MKKIVRFLMVYLAVMATALISVYVLITALTDISFFEGFPKGLGNTFLMCLPPALIILYALNKSEKGK